jgi:hypothetical protein
MVAVHPAQDKSLGKDASLPPSDSAVTGLYPHRTAPRQASLPGQLAALVAPVTQWSQNIGG